MTRQTELSVSVFCEATSVFPNMTPILDAAEFIFLGNRYISCFFLSLQLYKFTTKLLFLCVKNLSSYVLARKEKLQSTSNAC